MKPIAVQQRPIELLRYAGLFTWTCALLALLILDVLREVPLPWPSYVGCWVAQVLFGVVYWHYLKYLPGKTSLGHRLAYLSVLTLFALVISLASNSSIGGILLLPVAGLLPWMLPLGGAVIWLLGQTVLLGLVVWLIPGIGALDALINAGLLLGISLFVFIGSLALVREKQSRDELRMVNHELQATQALLAQNTRIAERVRIARELHDLVGHHLTALTLNLEVVTHLVEGKSLEHVQQAHALAKLLLADVREVVSDMRQDDLVDLAEALRTLTQGVPVPKIHLDLPSREVMIDPDRAQVLLRAAQEIITNSVRHARASNLWIRLSTAQDGIAMSARDDGRGAKHVRSGNGLIGMGERMRALGGKLEFESAPGAGFTLHLWMPLEG